MIRSRRALRTERTEGSAVALSLLACLAALAGCAPSVPALPLASAPDPARGEYLFNAADCVGCHTDKKHGGARLAGGGEIETPFGAYVSRNITPDPVFGIGAWSDADFLRALRWGVSPGGEHYFPAFPFPSFTGMTDRDILDIKAYLFTQMPQPVANRPHEVGFPFDMRASAVLWREIYFTPGPLLPDPGASEAWNRGRYLVTAVGHCGDCHTPRDAFGGSEPERRFAGARLAGPAHKLAPNISPDAENGLGNWSLDDIATVLKTGVTRSGDFVGAPMSDVVEGTAKLSDADRHAIAVYLKSVPPQPGKGG
jgi:mono/diheme cytochrome c family protein